VVASGSGDGSIRIWSPTTAECRGVMYGDGGDVYSIAWRPGGDVRYHLFLSFSFFFLSFLFFDFSFHELVAFRPRTRADDQDQIASAAYDRILRVWDVETSKQIRTFSGHTQSTLAVDYDDTGKLLASG